MTIPVTQLRATPGALVDARQSIDQKLDAALKEAIKESIASTSPAVEKLIDALRIDHRAVAAQTLQHVVMTLVVPALRRQRVLVTLADELSRRGEPPNAPTIAKLLQLDRPIAEHPLFLDDVRRSKLGVALRLSDVGSELLDKLDAGKKPIETWNDLDWDDVVATRTLTAQQRDDLRFTADLGRLTDHLGLVEAARKANVRSAAELVGLDATRWLQLVKASPTSVPPDMTPESYAAALDKTVQRAYPSQYFAARIVDSHRCERLSTAWQAVHPVLAANPDALVDLDPADIDWTGHDERQLAGAVRDVMQTIGAYRHLELADVAGDAVEVGRRVGALARFLSNNREHDLRDANLMDPEGAFDWSGIDSGDRQRVSNQLLAYQRVLNLAPDNDTAMALLRSGFDSSTAIGGTAYSQFRERTGLADADAAPVYRKASHTAARISNGLQLQKDATSQFELGKHFQGIDPKFVNDLRDIAGYAELFGDTTYCDCEHCRSIFSPAAYFTDLMYFIDKNITKVAFKGKPTHSIRLRTRRPDLWHLKLTCANTDTLVPHLTLVNEVLEAYLERSLSIADPAKELASDRRAIHLPFHTPLARVREYLREWSLDLPAVYKLLDMPALFQHAELLGVSDDEWARLVDSQLDVAWLPFGSADHTRMDVVDFLRFTELTRGQLDELAATATGGDFKIVRVKVSNDIQSEKEVVEELSAQKVDRIGRFLRLARTSGFTLTQLDAILLTKEVAAGDPPFAAQTLARLAQFKRLRSLLGLSIEQLIGVLDHIPTRSMTPDGKPLATRLGLGELALPRTFHHAQFATATPDDATVDPKLPSLLRVTGLAEPDLLVLFERCATAFPFDANGDVQLTSDNVSLLYAYSTLAKTWRLSIAELADVVHRRLPIQGYDFRTLDLLAELEVAVADAKTLSVSIDDAFSLIDPNTESVAPDLVSSLVNELQQSGARLFATSVLTAIPGIRAEDATEILGALVAAGLVEQQGTLYALTSAYTTATDLSQVLAGSLPVAAIEAALLPFHFTNLLPNALAATAGLDVDKALIAFAFARPGWAMPEMLAALVTPIVDGVATQPADLAPLATLANDLARVGKIFDALNLDADDAWFVAQYPTVFGIADSQALDLSALVTLGRYRAWRKATHLTVAEAANLLWQYHVRQHGNQPLAPVALFGPAARAPSFASALAAREHAALVAAPAPAFTSEVLVPSPLNADEIALWAQRGELDRAVLRSVLLSIELPKDAVRGVTRALELYAFCAKLGTRAAALAKLRTRDFDELETTADWLRGLIKQRSGDDVAGEAAVAAHTRVLDELRRDALCAYVIARDQSLGFRDRSDLYAYFLIDVEMAGCFDTSRLVAALSSLQLYVYRCLANLEQAKSDGLSVLPKLDAEDVQAEWEWRRNYRVWEANRKVFLYPESYIEPELRDDKTPLAQTLEDDLLQREITLEAAGEAYTEYLATFSTLARLKVVSATHDAQNHCYWFIARSHADPYQYFSRRYFVDTERWEPWEAIDVGISAPYVCAFVYNGRLYLFWVDVTSADKTEFVDGSSIFRGVESKVNLQYSSRENNSKWAPTQKRVLVDGLLDRCLTDETPAFIKDYGFAFIGIDKDKSRAMADCYRRSKTYAKVVVDRASSDSTYPAVRVHYFRQGQRTDAVISENHPTVDDEGHVHDHWTHTPIADSWIDRIFVSLGPNAKFEINDQRASSFQYFRADLDLITSELKNVTYTPHVTGYGTEAEEVPVVGLAVEDKFYEKTTGVEAIGILRGENAGDPESKWIGLMLRHYANAGSPAATDAMLITKNKKSGTLLTNTISASNAYDVLPMHNKQEDTVLQHWQHQHWIQHRNGTASPRRLGVRINTTLDAYLTERLFTGGIDEFLTLKTQTGKGEVGLLFGPASEAMEKQFKFESDPWMTLPFKGSFGLYYQELFFHIPFLIANQLNAQGKYEDAKYWYEKIFNPMAPAPANDPDVGHRVWQYQEFRDVKVPSLKAILTDKATIELYHDDPFNPHAIARLRLSAYQKALVMKYVDNLIDWADDLFTQATMESVNEAIMLYVLAAEIMGPRPVSVGACKTANEQELTYAVLGPAVARGSEFLMYVENVYHQLDVEKQYKSALPAAQATVSQSLRKTATGDVRKLQVRTMVPSYTSVRRPAAAGAPSARPSGRRPDLARHYLPAFCVPPNEVLLGYWGRIEDRLFKIRHCLDINGQPLKLALFQPPIDPMLLVRARAAGLSIEDVVGQLNEPLPPYRFAYLLEKARQFAATVQSFGSALLSALEKKDGEQLAQLRATHEQNVFKLLRSIKQQAILEAQTHQAAAETQVHVAQIKLDHFTALIAEGLNGWEITQQVFKHTATGFKTAQAALHLLAGVTYLIPQLGSPFAMKFGGKELGDCLTAYATWLQSFAEVSESAAGSAGLEASFQRRSEEWEHSLAVATEELTHAEQNKQAAETRVRMAEQDLAVLEKQLEQAGQVDDFLTTKFTNDQLYTHLSSELMKLYRESYQMASQIARQAERALQFERDSTELYVQTDNWRSDQSGLLAGERLQLQLHRMEKAYLDDNKRDLEVRQSFSLLQIDPAALQSLRQTGKCQFVLDEAWFDIAYPGQYRRLIKTVRLTIPCVVGPYVNVAANLVLLGSQVRRKPDVGVDPVDVPLTMTRTIATSHGQNDGGAFELNFRDERYLPFEGAGAVNSRWSLELPSQLRLFDYDSLADVIVSLEYTARHDGTFAAAVEGNIVGRLKDYGEQKGLFRLVSMRHELPDAFYQLCNPPAGQTPSTSFALEKRHFPVWLDAQKLKVMKPVGVWPQAKSGQQLDAAGMGLHINGTSVAGWVDDGAGSSRGTVSVAGSPIRSYAVTATAIDKANIADIVFLLQYSIQ